MADNISNSNPTQHIRTTVASPTVRTPIVPGLGIPNTSIPVKPVDETPIELVDDVNSGNQIRAMGAVGHTRPATEFHRQTTASGFGACRVRTFHARLSDEGLAFMDQKINEWLDRHPEIEVKHVTSTVGMIEGKIKEPSLVLVVWY